jgi:hypothetical protein
MFLGCFAGKEFVAACYMTERVASLVSSTSSWGYCDDRQRVSRQSSLRISLLQLLNLAFRRRARSEAEGRYNAGQVIREMRLNRYQGL